MPSSTQPFTLGVEEEYQLVSPATRELVSRAQPVLAAARPELGGAVQHELQRSQIEIATPVCHTLDDVRNALIAARREVRAAAEQDDCTIAAAGTHPFSHWDDQERTAKPRYRELENTYQQLAREQLIFGCHVHVGVADPAQAIAVLNRMRIWLAPLLALSANSPFWMGEDTGYASYRTELWSRWPISGPPHLFDSRDEYEKLVQALVNSDCVDDASKIYWDIRIPQRLDTIEVRVPDICMTIDEAVLLAGLTRALVQTCYDHARADAAYPRVRPELLRGAHWRAARYGLSEKLVDPAAARTVPAAQLVETMLEFARPALEENGDWALVAALVQKTLRDGNGADRQRRIYAETGSLVQVVDFVCAETAKGL